MPSLNKPTRHQAILIMDSRQTSMAVRSQNLTGAWSQLYKAGDFYLDLSFKPQASGAVLQGHIVAEPSRHSHLNGVAVIRKGDSKFSTPIGTTGSFRLTLAEPGKYGMEIVLQDQVIHLEHLEA